MPSFTKKILGALGVTPKQPLKPKPAAPTYKSLLPPSERMAHIDQIMAVYRQNAPAVRGMIELTLKQMRDRPPNPKDPDSVRRLLGLYRANLDLRQLMDHRARRYLVLVGLRELLEQRPAVAPPGVKKLVGVTKRAVKR
jgi:hypothetical protein